MSTDSSKSKKHPWSPGAAVAFVLLSFAMFPVVASVALTVVPAMLGWDSVRADEWLLYSPLSNFLFVLLTEVLTVSSLLWFITYKKAPFLLSVMLKRPQWRDLWYAILGIIAYFALFVVVFLVVDSFTAINTDQEQALGFDKTVTGVGLVLAFISLVILPPLAEEILFRGFFYTTLRAYKLAVPWSILITSVIFGSLHLFGAADGKLLWIAALDTFVLSIVLCYVREKTGSLWASIGVHALKNGFVFLNLFIIHAT